MRRSVRASSSGKTSPASREELWKLLVRITMCTVVNTAHRHLAARRDVRRERTDAYESPSRRFAHSAHGCSTMSTARSRATRRRSSFLRKWSGCSTGLSADLRGIVSWKLEGFTNAEIAAMLGRTVRSVELKMQVIRKYIELERNLRRAPAGVRFGPGSFGSES